MNCVCIIPARGGSTRIKDKNIRIFHGKPIIAYSIETAKKSGIFDQIIVSTDSENIATVARHYGAEVMMRSERLSQNDVGTQEVMAEVLKDIECDYACCLYATAPLLSFPELITALEYLRYAQSSYVVPISTWLRDPGLFYFGRARAFKSGLELLCNTMFMRIHPSIDCDINTEDDWLRAEQMYADLHVGEIQWCRQNTMGWRGVQG